MNIPLRPDQSVVSKAIPLIYVGRNRDGCWVALDADTGVGGLFLFKSGALRFSPHRNGRASATMELARLELSGRNRGNLLVGYLATAKKAAAQFTKIAGTVVAFALVLAAVLAVDVAVWVPHVRP